MAYQPKSYRKFLVGAVTTAVVASSFTGVAGATDVSDFKDVNDNYKEAVSYLVSKGISGISPTEFGTYQNIKRVDAAVFVVKALELDVNAAPASGFTDVPERAVKEVNALKAAGITNGKSETTFGAQDYITRGELAKWLVAAFELEGTADISAFGDVPANYTDAISTLVANNITNGTSASTFGTYDNAKRGDFAKFILASSKVVKVPAVTGVSAINAKTLALTGTALQNLKAENITVEGNKVTSVTGQGKSATVALETPLVDGQEYKVTVKVGEETKEFKVKFTFVLADIAVTTTTLEANKDKQFLQVTLNGAVTDLASIDSLGYDIEFQADEAVFATGGAAATTSTTGEIDEKAVATALNKSFNVKAVLTKDGKTAESKTVKVDVVSKATPAIGDIVFTTDELTLTKPVISTKDSTVAVDGVKSNTGNVIDKSGLSSYASSNPEVALINAQSGAITPIKAGKTTITVKAGSVVYSKEITVVSEARVATKATADTATVAPGATLTTNVAITDQFGEKVDVSDIIAANIDISEVTGETKATSDYVNAVDGKLPVTIAPAADATAGSYTVVVKDLTTLKNLGQFTVKVTADNTADNYKLEVADTSKGVVNLAGTKTLTLNAKEFTKSGGFLQKIDSGDTAFTVESANPTIATVENPDDKGNIVVTGVKVGSTQIILKKGGVQVATATVTVKEEVATIESITWKANASTISVADKAITYKDIFTITETATGVDTIVEGVKLNIDTTSKVRVDLTNTAAPVLYLDQNDDGDYVAADDEILGTVDAKLAGTADQTIALASTQDWTTNILSATTASKNKGTIIFTVTDDDTNKTVRESSTLNVDVK